MAHGESGDEQERYRYLDKIDYVVGCKQKLGIAVDCQVKKLRKIDNNRRYYSHHRPKHRVVYSIAEVLVDDFEVVGVKF